MRKRIPAFVLLFALVVVFGLIPSYASWQQDGVRVCIRTIPDPDNQQMTSDGAGGAIVAWDDERYGNKDIYAQWADSSGTPQWTENGVAVCVRADEQAYPRLASDGVGGAIIIWRDDRNGDHDIYAQRVDAAGTVQWVADGVAICTASGNQDGYRITPDGAGGAIIFWWDERGTDADIYAQRVNASGIVQWTADGVAVCTAVNDQEDLCIEADGTGGAVACWTDYRAGRNTYAQHVDQTGTALWAADGVSCGGYSMQYDPQIIPDGAGGAIVTWRYGIGSDADVLAQRIDAAGARQWGADGLAVCAEAEYQGNPQLASDSAGGAIITWVDSRGGYPDIYAQRVDASGAVQWAAGGIAVCTPGTERNNPLIIPDGAGGAIIAWEEEYGSYGDIYAQRVDAAGILQWPADGAPIATGGYLKRDPSIISDGAEGAVVIWWQGTAVCGQRVSATGDILWIEIWGITFCTGSPNQIFPAIVSDDAGGAIVAWADYRSGFTKVYAQRIDAAGDLQWPSEGVQLCMTDADQYPPEICSDGAGGAIITWFDKRDQSDDVYVQRVDASGAIQWGDDAVAVCTAWGDQFFADIVSDGAGGAIMTWMDIRSGFYVDIYAQRVDASGVVQWTTDGVAVCTASNDQVSPHISSDGAGGAIITWADNRLGTYYYDIYAQRVDASGVVQWTVDGIAVCTAVGDQDEPRIASDGAGGAIITWMDSRNGNYDIYAQRVGASGVAQWTTDGIAICTAAGSQALPQIASDGTCGAHIAWRDERNANDDIYSQRIDADGAVQWIADGLPIRTVPNDQSPPEIVPDGAGGAVIVWSEYLVKDSAEDRDLYAQRISAMGAIHWAEDGVPLCTAVGFQQSVVLCTDGAGGAIATWTDGRSDTTFIYAGRVDSMGNQPPMTCYELPVPEVLQPDSSYWSWAACSRAVLLYSGIDVDICDIANFARENNGWGEGDCCPFDPDSVCNQSNDLFGTAGSVQAILANWGVSSTDIPSALSLDDMEDYILAGSAVFVAWDDGNDANGEPHIVVVHGVCEQNIYIMDPSSDNDPAITSGWMPYDCLAAGLAHEPWTASLVADYVPTNSDSPVPRATSLAQNYPNPFNPTTVIPFMLHAPANVSLNVYDVSGRLVRTIFTGRLEAGRHLKEWDGTDGNGNAAASGIYFYRLKAGDFEETRKMVLVR